MLAHANEKKIAGWILVSILEFRISGSSESCLPVHFPTAVCRCCFSHHGVRIISPLSGICTGL